MDESGIAWSSDIKKKFGSQLPSNFNSEEFASNRGGATINGEAAAHLQAEHGTWVDLAVMSAALAWMLFRWGNPPSFVGLQCVCRFCGVADNKARFHDSPCFP